MNKQTDKLEDFVRQHKDGFDVFEPSDKVWETVSRRTKPVRKLNFTQLMIRVAAGVAIFLASWFLHDWIQPVAERQAVSDADQINEPEDDGLKVLMEAEVFYTSKIFAAKEELIKLSGNDRHLLDVLDNDLVELDQVFEALKKDLKDEGDNQEVIGAMIQNYRIRLQILEEMLRQMQKNEIPVNKEGYEI